VTSTIAFASGLELYWVYATGGALSRLRSVRTAENPLDSVRRFTVS